MDLALLARSLTITILTGGLGESVLSTNKEEPQLHSYNMSLFLNDADTTTKIGSVVVE